MAAAVRIPSSRVQRGAATLAVVALLGFALLLVVASSQRQLVVEARGSAAQLRAQQSFEAAEAGLEWALAQLNSPRRLDDDCRPSADVAARPFRERQLQVDAGFGGLVPATWDDAGTATPLAAACRRDGAGWTCRCPASGAPTLGAGSDDSTPAFRVELARGAMPGLVRIVATGCVRADAACAAPTADGAHEAATRLEVTVGLLPGLRALPHAALLVGGRIDVGAAPLAVTNRDAASGGVAVASGGALVAAALQVAAPAGSDLGNAVVSGDASLRAADADRFFAEWLGMAPAAWTAQPAVTRVACRGDCTSDVAAAIAAGARLVALDGADVRLAGAVELGRVDRPVLLVALGALRLDGAVVVHGGLFAGALRVDGDGGRVHGAVVVHGDVGGDAGIALVREHAVLADLHRTTGSYARVAGSWKDF